MSEWTGNVPHFERPWSSQAPSNTKADLPVCRLFSVKKRFFLLPGAMWPEFCSRLLCEVIGGVGVDATRSIVV